MTTATADRTFAGGWRCLILAAVVSGLLCPPALPDEPPAPRNLEEGRALQEDVARLSARLVGTARSPIVPDALGEAARERANPATGSDHELVVRVPLTGQASKGMKVRFCPPATARAADLCTCFGEPRAALGTLPRPRS